MKGGRGDSAEWHLGWMLACQPWECRMCLWTSWGHRNSAHWTPAYPRNVGYGGAYWWRSQGTLKQPSWPVCALYSWLASHPAAYEPKSPIALAHPCKAVKNTISLQRWMCRLISVIANTVLCQKRCHRQTYPLVSQQICNLWSAECISLRHWCVSVCVCVCMWGTGVWVCVCVCVRHWCVNVCVCVCMWALMCECVCAHWGGGGGGRLERCCGRGMRGEPQGQDCVVWSLGHPARECVMNFHL